LFVFVVVVVSAVLTKRKKKNTETKTQKDPQKNLFFPGPGLEHGARFARRAKCALNLDRVRNPVGEGIFFLFFFSS
jgi:hypothetical protein